MEEDDVWSGEYLRKEEGRPKAEVRQVSSHSDPGRNLMVLSTKWDYF